MREAQVSGLHSEERNAVVRQPGLRGKADTCSPVEPCSSSTCSSRLDQLLALGQWQLAVQKYIMIAQTTAPGVSSSQGDSAGGDASLRRSRAGTVGIRADMRVSSGMKHCLEPPHSHLC